MRDGSLMKEEDLSSDGRTVMDFTKHYPKWQELHCKYGQPGDRLWVRETWAGWLAGDFPNINYRAGGGEPNGLNPPGSRILLEIVSVRVERLQAISEADAKAEGAICCVENQHAVESYDDLFPSARQHYHQIWSTINGPDSWDANPWVWCIEFKRLPPTTT